MLVVTMDNHTSIKQQWYPWQLCSVFSAKTKKKEQKLSIQPGP